MAARRADPRGGAHLAAPLPLAARPGIVGGPASASRCSGSRNPLRSSTTRCPRRKKGGAPGPATEVSEPRGSYRSKIHHQGRRYRYHCPCLMTPPSGSLRGASRVPGSEAHCCAPSPIPDRSALLLGAPTAWSTPSLLSCGSAIPSEAPSTALAHLPRLPFGAAFPLGEDHLAWHVSAGQEVFFNSQASPQTFFVHPQERGDPHREQGVHPPFIHTVAHRSERSRAPLRRAPRCLRRGSARPPRPTRRTAGRRRRT